MTHRPIAILLCLLGLVAAAIAQESAPVTVDASPTAGQLLQQAEAAAEANPAEAARLAQEAVDRFAGKLVPWPPEPDRFRGVTAAAESFLRAHPPVLARWLATEAPVADRQLQDGQLFELATRRALAPAAAAATMRLAQTALDSGRPSEAWEWLDRALRHPDLPTADRARVQAAREVLAARWKCEAPAAPGTREPAAPETWQPLWIQPLPTAWIERRVRDMDPGVAAQHRKAALADGSSLLAAPTFHDGEVLLSDGVQAMAMDRFSGSELWSTAIARPEAPPAGPMGDLGEIVVGGAEAVTLPGHALTDARWGPASVLVLDARDGRRVWDLRLDRAASELMAELFPHGRPVIRDDVIVVQARKSNNRLESAAWLLGLDRPERRLRWSVPLGAAGGLRLAASRPLGSPVRLDGDVVVASSLGLVARIGAGLGEVRWLRRWPPPVREPRDAAPAWQLPSPVADARLAAWITPDGASIAGLDPADGHLLWTRPVGVDTPAGLVRTLLLDESRLYAIGSDVVALDRDDPRQVVWKLSERLGETLSIRGEVSLGTLADGSAALAVPTASRVLVVAPADGRLLGELPLVGGGNTSLSRGQLAVASADVLRVAMPGAEGEKLLRQRLAERPGDPRRGLALVELGRGWKRGAVMVDGARATASALAGLDESQAAPVREECIQRLVDPEALAAVEPAQAEQLLELAAGLARSPQQRAAVALRRADRDVAAGRVAEAAGACVRLWLDPELSRALLRAGPERRVAAGVLAVERLQAMGEAERSAMLRESASGLRDTGGADRLSRLRALVRVSPADDVRRELRSLALREDSCEAIVIGQLLSPMVQPTSAACGPLQSTIVSLPGTLVSEMEGAESERPRDFTLLHRGSELVAVGGPKLAERWRVAWPESAPMVLAWSPAICLWSRTGEDSGVLAAIDPATGKERFRIDPVSARLDPLPQVAGDGLHVDSRHVACLRAGPVIVLSRGDGELAAVRIDGAGDPAWNTDRGVGPRLAAAATNWCVAVVHGSPEGGEQPARITLRDPRDGSPWLDGPWPLSVGTPRAMQPLPEGLVVMGDAGVAMLELQPGLPPRWVQEDRRVAETEWRGSTRQWLFLKDRAGDATHGVSVDSGELIPAMLEARGSGRLNPLVHLWPLPEGWLAHRLHRLTLHDGTGRCIGSDAIAGDRGFDFVQPVRGAVIVADSGTRPDDGGLGQPPVTLLRTLETATGLRLRDPGVAVTTAGDRPVAMEAIDGWILLGLSDRTLAIPAPEGR